MEQLLKWGIKVFYVNCKKEGFSWEGCEQRLQQQTSHTILLVSYKRSCRPENCLLLNNIVKIWLVTYCTSVDSQHISPLLPSVIRANLSIRSCTSPFLMFLFFCPPSKIRFYFSSQFLCYIQAARCILKKTKKKQHLLILFQYCSHYQSFFSSFGPHYQCWKEHFIINTAEDASPSSFSISAVMYAGPNSVAMLLKPIKVFGTSVSGGNVHSLYHISFGYWLKCKRVYDFWLW